MMEIALSITNLSKSFGPATVLHSVDLKVAKGEVRALVGENGSGKSTLIKILSGYHQPDTGSVISVNGEPLPFANPKASRALGLCFVHQNLGLVETASVMENLFMANGYPTKFGIIRRRQARSEAREMLKRVNIDLAPETLISELSPAVKTGVALARVLGRETTGQTSVLVLDEPTATLPANEVEQLLSIVRTIAESGVAVIYVSHRLEEVFQIADSVTVIRDGREVLTIEASELTYESLLHHLLGRELETLLHNPVHDHDSQKGPRLLEVRGLVSRRLDGVSLDVRAGEILGLAGLTGSGREEFCSVVFGSVQRDAGEVFIGDVPVRPGRPDRAMEAGACFVSADRVRDGGFMELTARENMSITQIKSYWRWPALRKREEKMATKKWYAQLHVRPADAYEQQFIRFSGGNQQKIILARWLQKKPKVFLLDEPTQGVDVGTKAFIHQQLVDAATSGAAVVVSSSDHEELSSVCHRVAVMRRGQVVKVLKGGEVTTLNISQECLDATRDFVSQ